MTLASFARSTLAAVLLATSSLALADTPDTGSKAPDFELKTPEGATVSLSSLTAKGPVVLVFLRGYPGYQCPYCQKQAHDFEQNAAMFAAQHAQILLVYPGPPAELDQHARDFLSKQDALPANYHLVTDPDYTVTNQYSLRWDAPRETAYPSTFLIQPDGTIFFRKISRSHGDRTSAADILQQLQQHQAKH